MSHRMLLVDKVGEMEVVRMTVALFDMVDWERCSWKSIQLAVLCPRTKHL